MDPLRKVIDYIWPEIKGVYGEPIGIFLKEHQEDWENICSYDKAYIDLQANRMGSLHGHTGAPTPVMIKHAAYYGLTWEDGVVWSDVGRKAQAEFNARPQSE